MQCSLLKDSRYAHDSVWSLFWCQRQYWYINILQIEFLLCFFPTVFFLQFRIKEWLPLNFCAYLLDFTVTCYFDDPFLFLEVISFLTIKIFISTIWSFNSNMFPNTLRISDTMCSLNFGAMSSSKTDFNILKQFLLVYSNK